MTGHRLIVRDGYDECLSCGQTFDQPLPWLSHAFPCRAGATEPHVWTATRSGAECAYCHVAIDEQASTAEVPADCTPV
ncbi:hypothetical protein [Actinopolymorpha sp. B9G3]|uniref:hypothetical protein n=1 Tax=Actinopolymorpha sp. B9G3 TaxID=3158970 RepID=UPI0032D97846